MTMTIYTQATDFFDYHADNIQALVEEFRHQDTQAQIAGLYLKVRDGWRYNAFNIGLTKANYIASHLVEKEEGHCLDKAIIYAAGLRALGIPARLHLAKVSNHIATEHLEKLFGTNELAPHGLVDVFYNNQWVKCSPAFNKELCDKYNVDALEFDGTYDSVMQEYNRDDHRFMSYLEDYGHFEDVPLDRIVSIFKSSFPQMCAAIEANVDFRKAGAIDFTRFKAS